MRRYRSGAHLPPGCYWSPASRTIEVIEAEGGMLRGAAEVTYVRVPRWLCPILGACSAALGGAYILCLPMIFFAMLVWYVSVGIVRVLRLASRALVRLVAGAGASAASRSDRT